MSDPKVHRARLLKWIGISLGIHAILLVVTSVGWFLGGASAGGPAVAGGSATAAVPATLPRPAANTQKSADPAPAPAVPPVPAAKNRDAAMFGPGETDPKKLQEGPDSRSDLDALK